MGENANPLGLKKIHHVEFYVGNAKQAEFYYRKAFGFSRAAYSGLETGNRETTSYLLKQNNVNFVLTTPLSPEHPAAEHIKPVSYTHLRAHETPEHLVCRLLL